MRQWIFHTNRDTTATEFVDHLAQKPGSARLSCTLCQVTTMVVVSR